MKCRVCGGGMYKSTRYKKRTVQYIKEKREVITYSYICSDCGKMRNEEHEDVPGGYSIGWDVIEECVSLKKRGMKTSHICSIMRSEHGIHIPESSMIRYFQVFGKGTL